MLIHRSSSESQYSTDSVLSCGSVASCLPISIQSFEWQLTKETLVTIEEMVAKSEIATVRSLNSTVGNGVCTASSDGFVYNID
jgi:hypothetical protein